MFTPAPKTGRQIAEETQHETRETEGFEPITSQEQRKPRAREDDLYVTISQVLEKT